MSDTAMKWRRLRLERQSELSECGMACLLMILNGAVSTKPISFGAFRKHFSAHPVAMSLLGLRSVARELGLQPKAMRADGRAFVKIATPFIAHWQGDHFVVVERLKGDRALIHDPAIGTRWLTHSEFVEHFSGFVLQFDLERSLTSTPILSSRPHGIRALASTIGRVKGARAAVLSLLLLGLAIEALALATPLMVKRVVDGLIHGNLGETEQVLRIAALFGGVVILQSALLQFRFDTLARVAAGFNLTWVREAVGHLVRLPMSFFQRRRVADIASRVSSIESVQRIISTSLVSSGLDGIMAVAGIAFIGYYSYAMAVITATTFITYVGVRALAHHRVNALTESRVYGVAKNSVELIETLRSIQALKLAGLEAMREERYAAQTRTTQAIDFRLNILTGWISVISSFLINAQRIALLVAAFFGVRSGVLSIGSAVACLALAEQFSGRGPSFVDRVVELKLMQVHLERLSDILDAEVEGAGGAYQPRANAAPLHLSVKNLGFRHPGSKEWLFRGLTFDCLPGSCTLIAGASGVGKTTLLKILLGLLTPSEGEVIADGVPLNQWIKQSYRHQCTTVMQDDCVIAGTVMENITFFDPLLSESDAVHAAQNAQVHDEITMLPMGYRTKISDLDGTLSGGQRQRILLARALCKVGRFLVLDEAFSHLDRENRIRIGTLIARLGMTRLVVSHTETEHYQVTQTISLSAAPSSGERTTLTDTSVDAGSYRSAQQA